MASMLEGEAEQLTRKVIDLAKAGDTHALRLCMDRLMPARKDPLVSFEMPRMQRLEDISIGMQSIVAAIAEAKLTPQEGESMSRILTEHATVMVNQDLQRRVEKLELGPSADRNSVEIVKSYR